MAVHKKLFGHFFKRMDDALDKDTCSGIAKQVLYIRDIMPPEVRKEFNLFINSNVDIKGFRNSSSAPVALLSNGILKQAISDRRFLLSLIFTLIDNWPEASKILEQILDIHLPELITLENSDNEKNVTETIDGFISAAVEELTKELNCTDGEATALICVAALQKIPDEAPESDENKVELDDGVFINEQSIWDKFLEEAATLPADSPEWEKMDQFIASLQQLAEEKAGQNNNLLQVENALNRLKREYKDVLAYFNLADGLALWEAKRVPMEKVDWIVEEIDALIEAMRRYREIESQSSKSVADARRQRKQLAELEEIVEDGFGKINALFSDAAQPDVSTGEEAELGFETEAVMNETEISSEAEAEDGSMAQQHIPEKTVEDEAVLQLFIPEETKDGHVVDSAPENIDAGESEIETSEYDDESREKSIEFSTSIGETESEEERRWSDFCWELLKEDDLAGAYWFCTSLETQGKSSPVPAWLLQAVQGARWLAMDSGDLVDDLADIARTRQPGDSDVEILLGLAASLRPAVIAPVAGMLDWLKTPSCLPALNGLVQTVKNFAHYGRALHSSDLRLLEGVEQYEEDIKMVVKKTKQWLTEAPRRKTKLARATKVWIELVKNEEELKGFLNLVAGDCRSKWKIIQEKALDWMDRTNVESRIASIDHKLTGHKLPAITGAPRDQIMRYVRDACELALLWCEFVKRYEERKSGRGDWLAERISALRAGIQSELNDVRAAVHAMKDDDEHPGRVASALCMLRSLEQLCRDLNVAIEPSIDCVSTWDWLAEDSDDLEQALMNRLLLLPEIDLDHLGRPANCAMIAEALIKAKKQARPLEEIIDQWLEKKDFRFVQSLINIIDDEAKKEELSSRYEEELRGSAACLGEMLHKVRSEVEQAVVDGILSDEERAARLGELQNIDLEASLDYHNQQVIIETVRQSVKDSRKQKLDQLSREWKQIRKRLLQYPGDEDIKADIIDTIANALNGGDSRVVEECIAQLIELMELGDPLRENPFSFPSEIGRVDVLKRFVNMSEKLNQLLEKPGLQGLQSAVKNGGKWGEFRFNRFPRPLQDEVISAINSWRWLKQGSARGHTNAEHIVNILRYLGFHVEPTPKVGIKTQNRGEHWLYLRVHMSTGGRAPIPQFGSQQQNLFDVVCLWERPSVDTLTSWMKDLHLENRNILVIYLGRMSIRRRNVMRQITADWGLTIAVLDEILFAYLSAERLERLHTFFYCTLPFAPVNPYTPFRAGDVPPEMFFGRKAMARELQRAEGSCIVYGGRQLGKSALLRHVQREFYKPEREQYAFVDDIKLIGSPTYEMDPQAIWIRLRDIFKSLNLLSEKEKTENPKEIAKLIENAMQQRPHCRVLVLFDEADNFLDADAANDFNVVDGLRILMSKTERRFKVILAGLHNVQRFQGRGNQPLAHFGTPICVGPLEPDAAQRLIREPLETLGFYFTDSSVILSILSYTNYHPGLIQLFCQELLNSIDIPQNQPPPYKIDREDVESVYRKAEVRARICERFDWTLALDKRYQAIAWVMIYDQFQARNGFSQAYPAGEILNLVREWWPQGFRGIESDQLRGLLDEMCGLGVLVRTSQGHYRLRSPNLVRLMENVEDRLLDLLVKEPEPNVFDPDKYHALLPG